MPAIGERIIENLDERSFLDKDCLVIAAHLGAAADQVIPRQSLLLLDFPSASKEGSCVDSIWLPQGLRDIGCAEGCTVADEYRSDEEKIGSPLSRANWLRSRAM